MDTTPVPAMDLCATLAQIDDFEAHCGFSLQPLRRIAELLQAGSSGWPEPRVGESKHRWAAPGKRYIELCFPIKLRWELVICCGNRSLDVEVLSLADQSHWLWAFSLDNEEGAARRALSEFVAALCA